MLVNLVSFMICIVGIISIYFQKKETFPNVDFEMVIVTTAYPASSAEDVEKLVSLPIERQISTVDGIKRINNVSLEGLSVFYLEIEPDYSTDDVLTDIRNAVESVDDLPDEVETPLIQKVNSKLRPIMKVSLSADDEWELRRVSKKLRDQLERIPGVARVGLEGYRNEILEVAIDPKKLNRYELSIAEVTSAIASRNINLSAGRIKKKTYDLTIRTASEFIGAEEIGEVIVRSNDTGLNVRVKDVAEVSSSLAEESTFERSQGKRAIFLDVIKKDKGDILKVTDEVKEITERFFKDPQYKNLNFVYTDESAFYVKRRLRILTQNGTQGLILVFLCLLLFMNFRISLVTSLGAPIAFMVAFSLMDPFGVTINLISMFGLIMVLGMLVDDSIIVAEQFYQYLEQGMKPRKAAAQAAIDTIRPVTATILTTVVAFGALFFMGGIMGKFLWPVPAIVIICLTASWLECFFILPSHLNEFVRLKHSSFKDKWYQPLIKSYRFSIQLALNHYKKVIAGFLALFVAAIIINKKFMRFELFPSGAIYILQLNTKGEVGTSLTKTEEVIKKMEEVIFKTLDNKTELEQIRSIVGKQINERGARTGTHYGGMLIYLTPEDTRENTTPVLMAKLSSELKKALPNTDFLLEMKGGGPPKGKPVNIELLGDDLKTLYSVSKQVLAELKKINGVTTTELEYEEIKKQLIVKVNEEEAKRLGLTTQSIARELRRAYEGDSITEIRRSDEDIEIKVRLNRETRSQEKSLLSIPIPNATGRRIKLAQVAKIETAPAPYFIRRFDKKRTIAVQAEIDVKKTTSLKVNREMKPIIDEIIKDHPTLSYELEGENKDTQESVSRLAKAGIVALFLIFIILVAMFNSMAQPLIVMSSIPLALIGVIGTFFILDLPISFMALLGMIGLIGVVVNDSIVLVTFINKNVFEEGMDYLEGIKEGCISRFRPVILTTFTTVAGLLPIAHAKGGDPFLKPMALSFAWGLLFSSTLTLIFVPCGYLAYSRIAEKWTNWRKK